ncbi:hypothetical protein [Ancylobacter rudongensis]|uniref:Uncharacterized protein n=1 Tax=Ancylobacter rudongensis TaxID=177413 RepID=A0A1G4UPX9_9HYPH|nr:hypothetical protein [Ancylobacter rudongensis]SCW95682.1 hypothetical protein SAMN05660859_0089 [Ancylobacter rudongensis]
MPSEPSISLNQKTLGFFLALVAVVTLGWNAVAYFKGIEHKNVEQDIRLDRTDEDRQIQKELIKETGALKEAVVKLTGVIEQAPGRKAEIRPSSPSFFGMP